MSDKENGDAKCPHCGSTTIYTFKARRIFKCKDCGKQFSLTSGTAFRNSKLQPEVIEMATNLDAAGVSIRKIAALLGVQYKTAFGLVHTIRAAKAVP